MVWPGHNVPSPLSKKPKKQVRCGFSEGKVDSRCRSQRSPVAALSWKRSRVHPPRRLPPAGTSLVWRRFVPLEEGPGGRLKNHQATKISCFPLPLQDCRSTVVDSCVSVSENYSTAKPGGELRIRIEPCGQRAPNTWNQICKVIKLEVE